MTDEDLLREANRILDSEFEFLSDHHRSYTDYAEYEVSTDLGPLGLTIHDDEGDEVDYPIGEYRYWFTLDTRGQTEPGVPESSARRMELMRGLYNGLVATGRYTCMFVWNLYRVLDTNLPGYRPPPSDK